MEKDKLWTDLENICKGFNLSPTDENIVNMMAFILEINKEKKMEHHPDCGNAESAFLIQEQIRILQHQQDMEDKKRKNDKEDDLFLSMLKKEELKKFHMELNLVERLRKIVDLHMKEKNQQLEFLFRIDLNPTAFKNLDNFACYVEECGASLPLKTIEQKKSLEDLIQSIENEYSNEYVIRNGKRYRLIEDNE